MKITATRQILGDYGTLLPGQSADICDDTAKQLLKSGLVVPFEEKSMQSIEQPAVQIDNKAVAPAEQPAPVVDAPGIKIQNKGK